MIAQIPLTRQENEVKRLEQDLCNSVSDLSKAARLCHLLQAAIQECSRLKAAFERDFSALNADANSAATGATSLGAPTDQLTVRGLPTDATRQNMNGSNGILGLSLNPSAPTFQPTVREALGDAVNTGQAGSERPPGPGLMSAQQYEALLDPNYIADRQWEWEEMQRQIDQLRVEQNCRQQASHRSAQTVWMHELLLQDSTAIGTLNDDAR